MSDAGGTNGYQKMPPGWDCKYDQTTGNCYYINYLTKAMQLEDPRAGRSSYKQLQNERCSTESIALQELSSPLPVQRARLPSNMSRRSTIQETSFSDTQAVVTKIQNMFPTADENHIRLLLKRYYNREAVVISALQVEKHPVTMPGPFVTPPAQRHLFHSNSAFYMTPPARRLDMGASRATVTSRTASPLPGGRFGSLMSMQSGHQPTGAAGPAGVGAGAGVGVGAVGLHGSPQWRSSPKPHSSPKMKLRYMKNIFPKADEMLLLDILANADNNVQFASEKLISLGYVKRDMQQPHRPNNRPPQLESEQQAGQEQAVQYIPLRPKEYTAEQKAEMESQLKLKYPHIAERIILMALESVNYAEDRATQILQIVQDEDEQRNQKQTLSKSQPAASEMKLKVDQVDATQSSKPHKQHRHLPSINVITPSTATTQIILSHEQTPEQVPNEAAFQSEPEPEPASQLKQPQTMSASSISSASTHSYASPPHSPTRPNYERLTTKSMLARSSCYNNNNISSGNNTNNNNSISSYASYSTSMGSSSVSASSIVKAFESRARTKTDSLKQRQHSSQLDNGQHLESGEFQSLIERMATLGANPQLAKGADENLLLADYVTWNGPNTTLCQKQTPQGPDAGLIGGERGYKAVGRNAELCKGPNKELSKGSIYARSKGANIKCN
ncbi:uncharacterized protein LOC108651891 isoform X3 [Drosophila navojoa]|uniref:uncharacterized protein LOC108651891 isoform X3 n=1 Tax=Drosophila navojoa TaxID=7232 RepID=UPI0011BF7C92|nr:uncharacterized protein LOC108651891 isoform X3 [Drosophila navojoa]